MSEPSTDPGPPPGGVTGRRTILVGSAIAVPAIALAVATPANAASAGSDLTFSQFAAQTANVSSYQGRPVYGPDQTPTIDFTVYNAGDQSSGSTSVQVDFDVYYVAEAYAPNGWTQTNKYTNGNRLVYVFRYNGGGLAGRSSLSASVAFKVRTDAPWGTNRTLANGTVQSTAADANTSNNSASTDFYVYQTKKYDLSFNYFFLQSDGVPSHNGRPLYGANNGPFLDARVYNAGPAAAANVSVLVDFAANQVAGMPDPGQGWTKIFDYTDKDRRVFRFRYEGIIGPGRDTGIVRLYFAVQNAQTLPPGYTLGTVNGEAEPGSGDSDYNNNKTSATFYTYR